MPKDRRGREVVDIDPFTFFGLFSKRNNKNREKIISAVKELFGIKASIPSSFDSIPVIDNRASFEASEDGDIADLWSLFESALAYAASPETEKDAFSKYFDRVINKKGNGNSTITMGLNWIAPNVFLNLGEPIIKYIRESGEVPSNLVEIPRINDNRKITASEYLDIVEKLQRYLQSDTSKLKNFMELNLKAWDYYKERNRQIKSEAKGVAIGDEDVKTIRYWIYSPGKNAEIWDECYEKGIMAIGWDEIGDLNQYAFKKDMQKAMKEHINPKGSYVTAAHATWQFVHEIKPGDIIFVKKGRRIVIGRGIVLSDYEFDDSREEKKNVRKVNWTHKGEWEHPGLAAMKTLTDITSYTDYVEKLNTLFESDEIDDVEMEKVSYPSYSEDEFLDEVYMDKIRYNTLKELVLTKKNVILQGAPGVGKTFVAKRLAYSIMKVKDQSRVMMVQFHQSYSYEDFIMGFRPSEKGFELKRGAFYNFCKTAEIDSENEYFFIIDEINRGNLSKIFGELFMLIESDKRGVELQLLYSDEKFSVPDNVYIIGMMNTADRSLAMLDYALRRRFAFYEMEPAFEINGFKKYQEGLNSAKFNDLIECIKQLNDAIVSDDSLGEGFRIGHSYFCNLREGVCYSELARIVEYELIPLLKEYWFDESKKAGEWMNNLRKAIE